METFSNLPDLDKRIPPDYSSGDAVAIQAQLLVFRKPSGPNEAKEWQAAQEAHARQLGQAVVDTLHNGGK